MNSKEDIISRMKEFNRIFMNEQRLLHVDSVARDMIEYITIYKLNREDALILTYGHDLAKQIPEPILEKMKLTWNLKSTEHEIVGSELMRRFFGVQDSRILKIAADHSECTVNDVLAKVFFVADCTDSSKREWDDPQLRQRIIREAKTGNIDLAVRLIKEEQARYYKQVATEAYSLIFD